jgi:hypothetical protein
MGVVVVVGSSPRTDVSITPREPDHSLPSIRLVGRTSLGELYTRPLEAWGAPAVRTLPFSPTSLV